MDRPNLFEILKVDPDNKAEVEKKYRSTKYNWKNGASAELKQNRKKHNDWIDGFDVILQSESLYRREAQDYRKGAQTEILNETATKLRDIATGTSRRNRLGVPYFTHRDWNHIKESDSSHKLDDSMLKAITEDLQNQGIKYFRDEPRPDNQRVEGQRLSDVVEKDIEKLLNQLGKSDIYQFLAESSNPVRNRYDVAKFSGSELWDLSNSVYNRSRSGESGTEKKLVEHCLLIFKENNGKAQYDGSLRLDVFNKLLFEARRKVSYDKTIHAEDVQNIISNLQKRYTIVDDGLLSRIVEHAKDTREFIIEDLEIEKRICPNPRCGLEYGPDDIYCQSCSAQVCRSTVCRNRHSTPLHESAKWCVECGVSI